MRSLLSYVGRSTALLVLFAACGGSPPTGEEVSISEVVVGPDPVMLLDDEDEMPPPPEPEIEPEPDDGAAASDSGIVLEVAPESEKDPEPDLDITAEVTQADSVEEIVEIQEQVLDDQIEDAEELNDELADIIERLREEKGLPEVDPYVSPLEQQVQQILQIQEPIHPGQVQDLNQDQVPPDEQSEANYKRVEPEPEQDQDQAERK